MKKIFVLLAALILVASAAVAEVDLSGMSFEELVQLSHDVDQAIWASDGWQEVTVPPGTYKIGEDIPVGKWTIKASERDAVYVSYCQAIDAVGGPNIMWPNAYTQQWIYSESHPNGAAEAHQITFECAEGMYIVVQKGNAVFSPATGKSSLGFK